jgi:anti-sigma factor RsiW
LSLEHREAVEFLEAYVLEALAPPEAEAVRTHLHACASCEAHVAELSEVVFALPEGLSGPQPAAALRDRILEAARLAGPSPSRWSLPSAAAVRRLVPLAAVLVAAIALAAAVDARRQLEGVRGELREYPEIAAQVSMGRWVRAANFAPADRPVQSVALSQRVDDFVQCAVTVETSESGRRGGPLVMQSRVFSQ